MRAIKLIHSAVLIAVIAVGSDRGYGQDQGAGSTDQGDQARPADHQSSRPGEQTSNTPASQASSAPGIGRGFGQDDTEEIEEKAVKLIILMGDQVELEAVEFEHKVITDPAVIELKHQGDKLIVIGKRPGETVVHLLGRGIHSYIFQVKGRSRYSTKKAGVDPLLRDSTPPPITYRGTMKVARRPIVNHAASVRTSRVIGSAALSHDGTSQFRLSNLSLRGQLGEFFVHLGGVSASVGPTGVAIRGGAVGWSKHLSPRSLRLFAGFLPANQSFYVSRDDPLVAGMEARSDVFTRNILCQSSGLNVSSLTWYVAAGCRATTGAGLPVQWNTTGDIVLDGNGGKLAQVSLDHIRPKVTVLTDADVQQEFSSNISSPGNLNSQQAVRMLTTLGPFGTYRFRVGAGGGNRTTFLDSGSIETEQKTFMLGVQKRWAPRLQSEFDFQRTVVDATIQRIGTEMGQPATENNARQRAHHVTGSIRWTHPEFGRVKLRNVLSWRHTTDDQRSWANMSELGWTRNLREGLAYNLMAQSEVNTSSEDPREERMTLSLSLNWRNGRLLTNSTVAGTVRHNPFAYDWASHLTINAKYQLRGNHTLLAIAQAAGDGLKYQHGTLLVGYAYRAAPLSTDESSFSDGRVTGLVFRDLNRNGLRDEKEPGLANMEILLSDGRRTVTNTEGEYEFRDVESGIHMLRINLLATPQPFRMTTASPANADLSELRHAHINFGLRDDGELYGRVYDDLDEDGEPDLDEYGVAKVLVRVRAVRGDERVDIADAVTTSYGYYRIQGLEKGTYEVSVQQSGLPPGYVLPGEVVYTVAIERLDKKQRDFALKGLRAIAGRVYADQNRNNHWDEGIDIPVAGAVVAYDGEHTALTGRSGSYIIRDVRAGQASVQLLSLPVGFRMKGGCSHKSRQRGNKLTDKTDERTRELTVSLYPDDINRVDFACEATFEAPLAVVEFARWKSQLDQGGRDKLADVVAMVQRTRWIQEMVVIARTANPRRPELRVRQRVEAVMKELTKLRVARDKLRVHYTDLDMTGDNVAPSSVFLYVSRTDALHLWRDWSQKTTLLQFARNEDNEVELTETSDKSIADLTDQLKTDRGILRVEVAGFAVSKSERKQAAKRAEKVVQKLLERGVAAEKITLRQPIRALDRSPYRGRVGVHVLVEKRPPPPRPAAPEADPQVDENSELGERDLEMPSWLTPTPHLDRLGPPESQN